MERPLFALLPSLLVLLRLLLLLLMSNSFTHIRLA